MNCIYMLLSFQFDVHPGTLVLINFLCLVGGIWLLFVVVIIWNSTCLWREEIDLFPLIDVGHTHTLTYPASAMKESVCQQPVQKLRRISKSGKKPGALCAWNLLIMQFFSFVHPMKRDVAHTCATQVIAILIVWTNFANHLQKHHQLWHTKKICPQ